MPTTTGNDRWILYQDLFGRYFAVPRHRFTSDEAHHAGILGRQGLNLSPDRCGPHRVRMGKWVFMINGTEHGPYKTLAGALSARRRLSRNWASEPTTTTPRNTAVT